MRTFEIRPNDETVVFEIGDTSLSFDIDMGTKANERRAERMQDVSAEYVQVVKGSGDTPEVLADYLREVVTLFVGADGYDRLLSAIDPDRDAIDANDGMNVVCASLLDTMHEHDGSEAYSGLVSDEDVREVAEAVGLGPADQK